jgi:hypothetical protein
MYSTGNHLLAFATDRTSLAWHAAYLLRPDTYMALALPAGFPAAPDRYLHEEFTLIA